VLQGEEALQARLAYYEHIAAGPHPTITVIEDLDATPGFGAWWGEVNTHVHRGLGSLGVITNGSIRDLDEVAENFQLLAGSVGPSHAFVHVVESAVTVTVHGMVVRPGDLIHADRHGAVVVPVEAAPQIPEAAENIMRGESVLIGASKKPDFSFEVMKDLMTGRRDRGH
jgi:regulator of RNase E activity RraA